MTSQKNPAINSPILVRCPLLGSPRNVTCSYRLVTSKIPSEKSGKVNSEDLAGQRKSGKSRKMKNQGSPKRYNYTTIRILIRAS